MMFLLGFMLGLLIGGAVGLFIAAMCVAAKDNKEEIDTPQYKIYS